MPNVGDEVGQPAQRLRFLRIDDEALEMESTWDGSGGMPPTHLHPSQVEHFRGLDGRVRAVVDGDERFFERGAEFEVPAGTPHQMAGDGPARVHWTVTPGLRTADFFEILFTGRADENFLEEFKDEIRFGV
jgi:mannose-6-phosphate isomerase-like protein (cupin superfamily)